jgi:hypothetical protein
MRVRRRGMTAMAWTDGRQRWPMVQGGDVGTGLWLEAAGDGVAPTEEEGGEVIKNEWSGGPLL